MPSHPPPTGGYDFQEEISPSPLELLARESSSSLRDTQGWLHRRVERISYTDRLMMRRRVSVDFTIPRDLPPFSDGPGRKSVFFVPVGLVRKWPPLMMWDFRASDDGPLPFLTSAKNAKVDAEALFGLAPAGELRDRLRPNLVAIPELSEADARRELAAMTESLRAHVKKLTITELDAWRRVVWVAGTMVGNSVVWARTEGAVGERHIVKFEFQQPVERELVLRRRILSAFSWGAIRVFLNLPNLGERGSYHLEITPPPGLEISTLHPLSLSALPPTRFSRSISQMSTWRRIVRIPYTVARQLVRAVRSKWNTVFGMSGPVDGNMPPYLLKPKIGEPYYWNAREKAYLYIESTQNQFAFARIDMAVSRGVLIRPALVVASIIAAFLTVATHNAVAMGEEVVASVTLLLLVPGFLGFLAIRPGEHPLVSRHLAGVTLLVIVATALPAVAAFVLIVARRSTASGVVIDEHTLHIWWRSLSWASWAIVVSLIFSWLLPVPEDQRANPSG